MVGETIIRFEQTLDQLQRAPGSLLVLPNCGVSKLLRLCRRRR